MDNIAEQIEKAGLLHDIGKVVQRAEPGNGDHALRGRNFLQEYMPASKEILRAIRYHHAKYLKSQNFSIDDIAWIVYEADNQASGTDRRQNEEDKKGSFLKNKCLDNVFNVFNNSGSDNSEFLLTKTDDVLVYPRKAGSNKAGSSSYQLLLQTLRMNFQQKSPTLMTVNELLRVLEAVMSYIPSSTAQDQFADISLYDHSKLTAAMAICMYRYFKENDEADYKKWCSSKTSALRKKYIYLLIVAELTGRENFIAMPSAKGTVKSLCGRSTYMELMLEHITDEILGKLGLSRSCLLFSGAGQIKLLLPNTEHTRSQLKVMIQCINHWLLNHFGIRLNFNVGIIPCAAFDFSVDSNWGTGRIFGSANAKLDLSKNKPYTADELAKLFRSSSEYNGAVGKRECSICHKLNTKTVEFDGAAICLQCYQMFLLGKNCKKAELYIVGDSDDDNLPELPKLTGGSYRLQLTTLLDAAKILPQSARRVYVKNRYYTGNLVANYLWQGDYASRDENDNLLDFVQMARSSGGKNSKQSIVRIGVLKIDVDDLQAAFTAGFDKEKATLSRLATMSRQLELFFRRYVNNLCAGEVNGYHEYSNEKFKLFWQQVEKARTVQIITAEGGQLLLTGAWDDLLELAIDIRRAFSRFTNDKLNFSAGLGLFHPKYPIGEMVKRTDELLNYAKTSGGKDSLALWGADTMQMDLAAVKIPCFKWEEFISGVYKDKMLFLQGNFNIEKVAVSNKLAIGKSLIYRIMNLLNAGDDGVNLARFAYLLARMEPDKNNKLRYECYGKVRNQFYSWLKQRKDRQELLTAWQLIVYHLRDKGELQ